MSNDTIVAIATAPTPGAVGIVRLSGPQSRSVLQKLCQLSDSVAPRLARFVRVYAEDGGVIDEGLALAFENPASYTGEDAAELQLHGNPFILQRVVNRCLQMGVRMAQPGEFSQRAFENGKLDLAQAEAVADLIAAESADAARAAQESLQGVFSSLCHKRSTALLEQRALIEAWLDFPDEDIGEMQLLPWREKLKSELLQLEVLRKQAEQGVRLCQGMTVLIVGSPNAGKSTLLNALAQREVAIVSDIAGTTRDLIGEHLSLNGVPLRIIDTAGLRADTDDPIEREGIARAHSAGESADRIICLESADAPAPELPPAWEKRVLKVRNKCDLEGVDSGWKDECLYISAKQGAGLDELARELSGRTPAHTGFSARQRHLDALDDAMFHVNHSLNQLDSVKTLDLAAEELRLAQQALEHITGEVTTEDLLGQIFSTFCIGK